MVRKANTRMMGGSRAGAGFWGDFADGFQKGLSGTLDIGAKLLPFAPLVGLGKKRAPKKRVGKGVLSGLLGAFGLGKKRKVGCGKKKARFVKGSAEAKAYMAKLRAMRRTQ